MNLKKISLALVVSIIMISIFSCSKSDPTGTVALKARAISSNPTGKVMFDARSTVNPITILSFKINIGEIEFEVADQDEQNENLYGALELDGPFELDLSTGSFTVPITTVELPNNVYSEIEFDLRKSTNANSVLFGKSIRITGTLNGKPFVFWHDAIEEIEVDYPNLITNITIAENQLTVAIEFNLAAIFGPTSGIDFTTVLDRDLDGIIEINPMNDDGNAAIAHQIKNLLKENSNLDND